MHTHSPFLKAAELVGLHGCCTTPPPDEAADHGEQPPKAKNTSALNRDGFAAVTASSLFPNTQFTNPESLPSFQDSFVQFIKTYPRYSDTKRADLIRAQEYYHLSLSNNICLDYIGIGLFSYWQMKSQYTSSNPVISPSSSSQETLSSDSPCFFTTSFKSISLKQQLLNESNGSELESSIKKRIMDFLNISPDDYSMVFTANKSSAFKLVADCYPFQSSKKLITVYDYESEALEAMVNTSERRGAKILSAEFKWPRLRVHAEKLKKMIVTKRERKNHRGLFVFPLQSRMTGASYSYQWMSMAQENGWHVLLDGCALGPKDMGSLGLSLISPDFFVCSFYKVFGENPTGFGCLFVKKSTLPILEDSIGMGIVSVVPPKQPTLLLEDSSGTDTEQEKEKTNALSLANPGNSEGNDLEKADVSVDERSIEINGNEGQSVVECRCLDQMDSLGLMLISSRGRFLINWLVNALTKLQHPNRLDVFPLVRVYGPKIKFDRGPALAFNIYDWKGEKVEPLLVQKLADRNNITLSTGFLQNIWFSDKYEKEKGKIIEIKKGEEKVMERNNKGRKGEQGISVVSIALNFLVNLEDIYRLWAFIAQFLDADFVEKERWRYTALNQKTIEV